MGLANITNNILTDTGVSPTSLISGSGLAGQIAYWTGASTQAGSNNLFWDAANARLGIGTNAPQGPLHINSDINAATNGLTITKTGVTLADANFQVSNSTNNSGQFLPGFLFTSNFLSGGTLGSSIGAFISARITNNNTDDLGIIFDARTKSASSLTQGYILSVRSSSTDYMRIAFNGNMILQNGGTFTDNGQRLQVQGTTLLNGNSTINGQVTITDANYPPLRVNRTTSLANVVNGTFSVITTSSSDMVDGFGTGMIFEIRDNANVINTIATISAIRVGADNSGRLQFHTSASGTSTIGAVLFNTNNLVLQNGGTFSDGGQRLQVYGDAFIKGSGDTSATTALTIQNSSSQNLLRIRNDGRYTIGNNASASYIQPAQNGNPNNAGGNLFFYNFVNAQNSGVWTFGGDTSSITSGFTSGINLDYGFSISSGTGVFNAFHITSRINQTFTANGITRGLYVNPTLTAAADWRSIEWSNNSGWGLYGAGTANNYLGGDLTFASSKGVYFASSALGFFGDAGIGSLTFRTNSTSRLTIDNGGNINAPNAPSATFSNIFITGSNIEFRNGLHFFSWENNGSRFQIKNITNANTIPFAIFAGTNNISVGSITDAGFKFDVNGTARVSGQLTNTGGFLQTGGTLFRIENSGGFAATGSTGNGIEMYQISGISYIESYNRTTSAYTQLNLRGSTMNFAGSSSTFGGNVTINQNITVGTTLYTSGGRVGIGTATPASRLEIANGVNQRLTMDCTGGINGAFIQASNNTTAQFIPIDFLANYYTFQTGTGTGSYPERMRLTTTGSLLVGGATESASAIVRLDSTERGFLPPRMTTTQKNAIATPAAGLQVYDSTLNKSSYYNGTVWVDGGDSIYNSNGTLTSNRTVSSGGFSLVFNPQTTYITTLTASTGGSSYSVLGSNTLSFASGFSSSNIGNVYSANGAINLQTFAGSATFAQANLASAMVSVNSIDFSAAGATITMTQASGIRAMTGHQSQIQYQGTNSGTITHAAVSQNLGFYRPSAATGTLTITNAYSFLINDLNDYGTGFTFTNRWGIYQNGASDNNYFKGKVIIGSTDTVGVSPLNVKNLPTSSAGLVSGDIWNNGGVLNIV